MRYPRDFLMKHNIIFSCACFFSFLSYHTHSHKHIHTEKKIDIILYALHSQTPGNLSALDFKVWVFAYFVLDSCHLFALIFSWAQQEEVEKETGCVGVWGGVWEVWGGACLQYNFHTLYS